MRRDGRKLWARWSAFMLAGWLCLPPLAIAVAQTAPNPAPSSGQRSSPGPAPGRPLSLTPPNAGAAPASPVPTARAALPAAPQSTPLPPMRPAGLGGAAADVPRTAGAPSAAPAAPAATTAAVPAGPLSDREAVARLNAYFNGFTVLSGDFTQVGPDGRRTNGRLYLQKPGKLRFDYASPSRIEIIADGTSVAVRDRRLNTQDLYPLGQTPLKFLLNPRIDTARDTQVVSVDSAPDLIRVVIEDKTTLGGTSRITLDYDPAQDRLRQWIVLDPQGVRTIVTLANLDLASRPDPALFRINYERMLGDGR